MGKFRNGDYFLFSDRYEPARLNSRNFIEELLQRYREAIEENERVQDKRKQNIEADNVNGEYH